MFPITGINDKYARDTSQFRTAVNKSSLGIEKINHQFLDHNKLTTRYQRKQGFTKTRMIQKINTTEASIYSTGNKKRKQNTK